MSKEAYKPASTLISPNQCTQIHFTKLSKALSNHRNPYNRIEKEPERVVDLLIVVDQMLTGFDPKWINTLYLDKSIEYENLSRLFPAPTAFSETINPLGQ